MTADPNRAVEPESDSRPVAAPDRREALALAAKGAAALLVAAILPRVRTAHAAPTGDALAWRQILDAAQSSIARGVAEWSAAAQLTGGQVNASAVFLPPGSLVGGREFAAPVEKQLLATGAPEDVASTIAWLAWEVWASWSRSWYASLPRAVPSFVAVPAPSAPPVVLNPFPLRHGEAPGAVGISRDTLEQVLERLLEKRWSDPPARKAMTELARWYSQAFENWYAHTEVRGLVASGPVPTFAPPYVPVGPVVNGIVSGQRVLDAPELR
jgi:hypothetical protein